MVKTGFGDTVEIQSMSEELKRLRARMGNRPHMYMRKKKTQTSKLNPSYKLEVVLPCVCLLHGALNGISAARRSTELLSTESDAVNLVTASISARPPKQPRMVRYLP
jgi:hypothetical protein